MWFCPAVSTTAKTRLKTSCLMRNVCNPLWRLTHLQMDVTTFALLHTQMAQWGSRGRWSSSRTTVICASKLWRATSPSETSQPSWAGLKWAEPGLGGTKGTQLPKPACNKPRREDPGKERKGGEPTNVVSMEWFQWDFPPCLKCARVYVLRSVSFPWKTHREALEGFSSDWGNMEGKNGEIRFGKCVVQTWASAPS